MCSHCEVVSSAHQGGEFQFGGSSLGKESILAQKQPSKLRSLLSKGVFMRPPCPQGSGDPDLREWKIIQSVDTKKAKIPEVHDLWHSSSRRIVCKHINSESSESKVAACNNGKPLARVPEFGNRCISGKVNVFQPMFPV